MPVALRFVALGSSFISGLVVFSISRSDLRYAGVAVMLAAMVAGLLLARERRADTRN